MCPCSMLLCMVRFSLCRAHTTLRHTYLRTGANPNPSLLVRHSVATPSPVMAFAEALKQLLNSNYRRFISSPSRTPLPATQFLTGDATYSSSCKAASTAGAGTVWAIKAQSSAV
ncbi:hypothetical protein FA95DRAFT_304071 [Auriscalpium vulgare]|uniref:Uncharacterized protein n=1 Tax=Auriscalpium vulgare TaxID=40419 RepID=A0ACB8RJN2_9AGAM|nr:hypothetical protein FA95DRAFT_304071 [Auriscalpium vulgare]